MVIDELGEVDALLVTTEPVKFIYSEKATEFGEIFPLLLTVCTVVKSKGKISQNFVAFSEYMNFTKRKVCIIKKEWAKFLWPTQNI